MARGNLGVVIGVLALMGLFAGLVIYRRQQSDQAIEAATGLTSAEWREVEQRRLERAAAVSASQGSPVVSVRKPPVPPPPAPPPAPKAPKPAPKDRVFTWAELEAEFQRLRKEGAKNPVARKELQHLYEIVAGPAYTHSQDYPEHALKLQVWKKEFPDSPTPLVAIAKAHLQHAWDARGSGYAGSVTEEGWTLFYSRLTEVRRQLEEAIAKGPLDSEVYRVAVDCAKGESIPPEKTWEYFHAGQKIGPLYDGLYLSMAQYLLPRWHGEPGDIARLANETLEKFPGPDGLDLYGHIAFITHRYEVQMTDPLFRGTFDRKRLAEAGRVMCERYPEYGALVAFAGICAFSAQDQRLARDFQPLFEEHAKADYQQWDNIGRNFEKHSLWLLTDKPDAGCDRWFWGGFYGTRGIAFSADSQSLWCQGSGMHGIMQLDAEDGTLLASTPRLPLGLFQLEIDPARKFAVACCDTQDKRNLLALWNLAFPAPPIMLPLPEPVKILALHPTRLMVAYPTSKGIHLLNLESGEAAPPIEIPAAWKELKAIRFSADGELFLAYSPTGGGVFNTESRDLAYQLPIGEAPPAPGVETCLHFYGFDADGSPLGIANSNSGHSKPMTLLRILPGAEKMEERLPNLRLVEFQPLFPLGISPDRRRIAAYSGHQLGIWDLPSGKKLVQTNRGWDSHAATAFSPDGKRFASAGGYSGKICIWDLD